MANTILIKRSSTPNAVPVANSISQGELAINLVDGNLFYKNSTDQVTVIASNKFVTVSGQVSAGGNVVGANIVTAGVVSATGNITGNYFLGNGALLTGVITSVANINNGTSNVTVVSSGGNVTIGIGGTANIAVFATTGLVVTGNVGATAFNGSGAGLTDIPGANVTGQVGNALVAGTVYTAAQPNITSVGTLSSLSVTGNVTGGNLVTAGNVYAPAIIQNASTYDTRISLSSGAGIIEANIAGNATQFLPGGQVRLSGAATIYGGTLDGSQLVLGTSQTNLVQNRGGNVTVQVGTEGTTANTWTFAQGGNLLAPGAISAVGNITGNFFLGNGSQLTGVVAVDVGTLTSLSVTGNVTAGNVNTAIVSATGNVVGANLVTTGTVYATDALFTGNLTVDGNTINVNITNLNVQDPIIGLGRGPNNTPLTTNDGKDRGTEMWYYASSEKSAFVGYQNLSGKIIAASNVTLSGEVVTVNDYGTIVVGTLEGAAVSATGNITGGNLVTAGTASVTGTITGGNIATAGTASAGGNVTGANLITGGLVSATGNITGGNVTTAGKGNIATLEVTTLANIKATTAASSTTTGALIVAGGVGVVGNIYAGDIYSTGNLVLTVESTVDGGTY